MEVGGRFIGGFAILLQYQYDAAQHGLRATLLVPRGYQMEQDILTSWHLTSVQDSDMFNTWRYYEPAVEPISIAVSDLTFDRADTRSHSTVRANVGYAQYAYRDSAAKGMGGFGELTVFLDTSQPTAIGVHLPVALSDRRPRTAREIEYQMSGRAPVGHTRDPRDAPWPVVPQSARGRPKRRAVRTRPDLNDIETRANKYMRA